MKNKNCRRGIGLVVLSTVLLSLSAEMVMAQGLFGRRANRGMGIVSGPYKDKTKSYREYYPNGKIKREMVAAVGVNVEARRIASENFRAALESAPGIIDLFKEEDDATTKGDIFGAPESSDDVGLHGEPDGTTTKTTNELLLEQRKMQLHARIALILQIESLQLKAALLKEQVESTENELRRCKAALSKLPSWPGMEPSELPALDATTVPNLGTDVPGPQAE